MNKTLVIGIAAVALIGIAVFGLSASRNTDSAGNTTVSPTTVVQDITSIPNTTMDGQEATSSMTAEAGDYTDGTYTSEGEYTAPSGTEKIEITVTLADGVIEDVEFTSLTNHPTSKNYQTIFAENYKPMVVGKSIDEVELDKVSGSSLTPKGFNNAIEQIKEQAQA